MTKAQHTACRWKAWTLKIHRKIKLRLRLKRKKEHLLSYTKLPTPYTRRAGPECPSTAGVSVPTTENGYCSLWQGKGSPVTQNIKFPPRYAETSLCTAYLTSVSHPSVWFKAVYRHVSIQKAWVKPNRECSPSALPRRRVPHAGGALWTPPPCVGWERALRRLALVLRGTLKFIETKKSRQSSNQKRSLKDKRWRWMW